MGEKSEIIRELGDRELMLPGLIREALQANDRVKYYFTLLQAARSRADSPDSRFSDLSVERKAAGIQDGSLDQVVDRSARDGQTGYYTVPLASRVAELVKKDIELMIAPLTEGKEGFENRLAALLRQQEAVNEDRISGASIDLMTAVPQAGAEGPADTFHAIVMDVHKALNRLQASVYQESVDGAKVYGITEQDRQLLKAFMHGVSSTAKLKFDHPGLGTTATRSPDGLVIQNDIGQTDAHVLVIRIKEVTQAESSVQTTYTDVHPERLVFFQALFEQFGTKWTETASRRARSLEEGSYLLTVGIYQAESRHQLEEYLYFLGSRIVFLIDWNRARKRLRSFVRNSEALKVLKWAAQNNHGHMGFLKLGGDSLVIEAIERIPKVQLRYGQKLDDVLGRESAAEFLKFVLRASSELQLEGKSRPFIRDEISAELARRFRGIYENLLEIASLHAELVVETSAAAVDAVIQILTQSQTPSELHRILARAGVWETRADNLLNTARQAIKRSRAPPIVEQIISEADDAIDSIEEAIFLLTLTPSGPLPFGEPLRELAELSNKTAMEYLKAAECSKLVRRAGQDIIDDLLAAVDMTTVLEHEQDQAYRSTKEAIVSGASDFRQLHLFAEIAAKMEQSTDSLMKSAVLLREYVMEEVMAQ
ncbi:MAG: hypothetical protein ABI361_13915 [Nitrososphaera sp.]